ncbi:MAG: hypothetical protein RLZZ292_837 [Bacteroidota bacterium]|jgi:HAD superfamily hydrolase (TIGR01490 family)
MIAKNIAIFDLDGTITQKDTFLEFIKFTHGRWGLYLGFLVNFIYFVAFFLKIYPNYALKERFFSFFYKNKNEKKLLTLGKKFAQEQLPLLCTGKAATYLTQHQAQRDTIVILTASSDLWLQAWCTKNNFVLIATHFEVIEEKFTGKILGKNCHGQEKVQRLIQQVDLSQYECSYGYGNSMSDSYFINLCTQKKLCKKS